MRLNILIFAFLTLCISIYAQPSKVLVLTYDGAINPACADYIQHGISKAEKENFECLILQLNTPGGLLKSTRVIVTSFLKSKVPIIVYVAPPGAQAASAGVFITIASNIAVMSPGTNIGAAHPVTLSGQQDSVMMEKATNDAAAFIRTISENRKRNISWAEDAVRKSLSITEKEALKLHVINYIADDIDDLLIKINGDTVKTSNGNVILDTKNAEIINLDISFAERILSLISDPNIAYILFMLGIYGLLFELFNPGAIFPGVIGSICLILAFYAMHTLPINYAGLALIIVGIILFILEIKIVSHGILTIGGIISLVFGSIMLINVDSFMEAITISWEVIAIFVVLTVAFFLTAIGLGVKAQKLKPFSGSEGLLNETGTVVSDLNPIGEVKIHGEIWKAESEEGIITTGSIVKVSEINKLKLKVKKI